MKRNDDKAGAAETSVVSADAALNADSVILQVYQVGDTEIVEPPKIRWRGSNYQSLLALFEMLHFAGYIDESDFRKTAAHVHHHFVKQDGTKISNQKAKAIRQSDNYNKKKYDIMDDMISQLADAIYDSQNSQLQK